MTAEQKERARHEVEVEKSRQLKRIADALELMAGMTPLSELIKKVDNGVFDRRYIVGVDLAKEDLKNE